MSFLAPLFLAGAAAIALPIIFHLIRRTVKDRVPFSALLFLKPSPPRLTKRSNLENLLLLALRCLVICLLAAGFARPYFRQTAAEPPKSAPGQRVVLVVDTSASMRRQGLWDAARKVVLEQARRAQGSDSLAMVTFDLAPKTILSFEDWQRTPSDARVALVEERLALAAPSWNSTHIGKALTSAAEVAVDAARADNDGAARSRLVLISDLQQGAKLDGLQSFEWPRGMEVSVISVAPGRAENAGLRIVPPPTETLSVTNIPPRAFVVNSPGTAAEQFKIGWASAQGFAQAPIEAHVPAGQSRSIALPAPPQGATNLSLLLVGDSEPFDNRAFHAAPPRRASRVAYIGSDSANDPNGQHFFVRRAFPETASLSVRVEALQPGSVGEINADLVIATQLTAADAPALRKHLEAGKGLLLVAAANTDLSVLASITGGAAPSSTEATGNYVMLSEINFEHPIFAPFRDARFSDFTKIHFWKHRKLDLTAVPNARAIASFDDLSPALAQLPVGRGSLYILASGWSPAESQLAVSSKFVPLLFSILEQTTPVLGSTRQLHVGDTIAFPADAKVDSIPVTKPDGAVVDWKRGEAFAQTDQPGFFHAPTANLTFAVNLDPSESRTAPLPEEQLASLGMPLKAEELEIPAELKQKREQLLLATEQEGRQKLWRKLLIACLALLLVETIAAWRATNRQPVAAAA